MDYWGDINIAFFMHKKDAGVVPAAFPPFILKDVENLVIYGANIRTADDVLHALKKSCPNYFKIEREERIVNVIRIVWAKNKRFVYIKGDAGGKGC
jgi:hypothetical protein